MPPFYSPNSKLLSWLRRTTDVRQKALSALKLKQVISDLQYFMEPLVLWHVASCKHWWWPREGQSVKIVCTEHWLPQLASLLLARARIVFQIPVPHNSSLSLCMQLADWALLPAIWGCEAGWAKSFRAVGQPARVAPAVAGSLWGLGSTICQGAAHAGLCGQALVL